MSGGQGEQFLKPRCLDISPAQSTAMPTHWPATTTNLGANLLLLCQAHKSLKVYEMRRIYRNLRCMLQTFCLKDYSKYKNKLQFKLVHIWIHKQCIQVLSPRSQIFENSQIALQKMTCVWWWFPFPSTSWGQGHEVWKLPSSPQRPSWIPKAELSDGFLGHFCGENSLTKLTIILRWLQAVWSLESNICNKTNTLRSQDWYFFRTNSRRIRGKTRRMLGNLIHISFFSKC